MDLDLSCKNYLFTNLSLVADPLTTAPILIYFTPLKLQVSGKYLLGKLRS
jgi:hypothetical protein